MGKATDCRPVHAALFFLSIKTRVPLSFGSETTTEVTCARVRVTVEGVRGRRADGWGETPLWVQWVWPSKLDYEERHQALRKLTVRIAEALVMTPAEPGHPLELGDRYVDGVLPALLEEFNDAERNGKEAVPWLAALVCASAFDLAVHDTYGVLNQVPIYDTYNVHFMNADLDYYLEAAEGSQISFADRYPEEFLVRPHPLSLVAWHSLASTDPIDPTEQVGTLPDDGHPVFLRDWIRRDGLECLKIKLRGTDAAWDLDRLVKAAALAAAEGVHWLTADFECTVHEPSYVSAILERLLHEQPQYYGMLLYVEQPFPYDLIDHRINVHSIASRKPIFIDESAHDWRLVRLGRSLGYNGAAIETCKTQTGAILSLCWAKAHGMSLMVQDFTNPMIAQISHVLLAAHAGTIMGVESNSMQFCPDASLAEAAVHPGLYRRRQGRLDLSTIHGPGFGYRTDEIERQLPAPDYEV
jgi:L-alanine-DL-glutamate epimerase-like enolase superfamily enzyme